MTEYHKIPNPKIWFAEFPDKWHEIAKAICPECGEPIGYDRLCETRDDGYAHSSCEVGGVSATVKIIHEDKVIYTFDADTLFFLPDVEEDIRIDGKLYIVESRHWVIKNWVVKERNEKRNVIEIAVRQPGTEIERLGT